MSKIKKDATGAPTNVNDNVAQGETEINAEIVKQILSFEPRDWMPDAERNEYDVKTATVAEIIAERTAACSSLDRTTVEYNTHWNGIRNHEYSAARTVCDTLETIAKAAFMEEMVHHALEVECAYREGMHRIIQAQWSLLNDEMKRLGLTMRDAQRIDAENNSAGAEYNTWDELSGFPNGPDTTAARYVLCMFSDNFLRVAIHQRLDHIAGAYILAHFTEFTEVPTKAVDAMIAEIVAQKWTIGEPPNETGTATLKQYSAGDKKCYLPGDAVNRALFRGSQAWVGSGHESVKVGDKLSAHLYVRVDPPADSAEYITGELLLPDSRVLDVPYMTGFDFAVYVAIGSIIHYSAEHGISFDPRRKMYLSTMHNQISAHGRRFTPKRRDEIANSIVRLNRFRQRVQCQLYRKKNGVDIMDGYSVEYPHIIECVPGTDYTMRGDRPYIRLLELPVAFNYTNGVNQWQPVPCTVFDREMNDSWEIIGLRMVMLAKYADMKRAGLSFIDITYDELYRGAGAALTGMTQRQKMSILEKAKLQLNAWATPTKKHDQPVIGGVVDEKTGKLRGYEPVRKGNEFSLRIYDNE